MHKCKRWLCCKPNLEQRSAGNPHATLCGGWNLFVNRGSFYPAGEREVEKMSIGVDKYQ